MKRYLPTVALAMSYFIFAILLNSVGIVILQSIETFDVTKSQASVLEGFKDLSIAFVSFFVASMIPRIGYQFALLGGLSIALAGVLFTPLFPYFSSMKLLFAAIGVGFALVKVSVYSLIGHLTNSKSEHSSLMNTIEGLFMVGTLVGYWLFSFFVREHQPQSLSWLNVYWVLAALLILTMMLVWFAQFSRNSSTAEAAHSRHAFLAMLKLAYQPLVLIFVLSVFLYVLIEQGIGTWLPTFNREVLGLSVEVSVQMTSIFAAGLAAGRLVAGQLLKRLDWFPLLLACLSLMSVLIVLTLPMAKSGNGGEVTSWFEAPMAAYLLPLIGFLMAPIYPVINSVMLSSLPKSQHAGMTGLIVVFSALGGTTGSLITGNVFQFFGGHSAFYFTLIPIVGLAFGLWLFRNKTQSMTQGVTAHG